MKYSEQKEQISTGFSSLAEAVFSHADAFPERAAMIDDKGVHTYREVRQAVLMNAVKLRAWGLSAGERLIVECTQDAAFIAWALAGSLTGAIFVPAESRVKEDRLREIVSATGAAVIVSDRLRKSAGESFSAAAVRSTAEPDMTAEVYIAGMESGSELRGKTRFAENSCAAFPDPGAPCEILFSSGTTGRPKGVLLSNSANLANAQNIIDGTHMSAGTVELVPLPLSHAHGLRTVYAHLLHGSTALIVKGITMPQAVMNSMEKWGCTALDLTPSAAAMLLRLAGDKLHAQFAEKIEYIELGAAFLPEDTKEELRRIFPHSRLYNFYGSSESGRTCVLDFSDGEKLPGCIGCPVPNAEFVICREEVTSEAAAGGGANRINLTEAADRQLAENGAAAGIRMDADESAAAGRLACRGPMNMLGYWEDPALTATTLRDGYVVMGDVGYRDEKGRIFILGRSDDVINYKGIKIAPEEIEQAAMRSGLIGDCACVPVSDPMAGQVPRLYVTRPAADTDTAEDVQPQASAAADPAALEAAVRAWLCEHIDQDRMPREIIVTDKIPRTFNGKILRRELRSE